VIEDDATGDVETSGVFDPEADGIDFWESMEGMLVELDDAVAVGPSNAFGETPVVGNDGVNASVRTARGGLVIRPTDFNPERLLVDDQIVPGLPALNVGDHYVGSLNGVLGYSFGNFKLELTSMPAVVHDGVSPESTTPAGSGQVGIGTFNVENLDPTDPPEKFARLAGILVNNLKSPDIVSVEEVQDNTGPADDGVVDADVTLGMLVSAIQSAGGPAYDYRQINPVNDADGGEPGGNIRQAFLFRTDRGLSFVDRPGGGPTTATTVASGPDGAELSASPGRIDPTNSAFTTSRKPLAGEFLFHGHHLFVIANHFNSKGGDAPLMGRTQPPTGSSEVQRHGQAQVVHDFVQSILSVDPSANVVVDGDLNDFEFSDAVSTLKTGVLHDLIETLPQNERYSYVFEGNSQTLDHVLLSNALFGRPFVYDVVHVNSEFADQASDHDPSVARITLNDAPTAGAGGPYTVAEGSSLSLSATGSDPEGGALTFAWDLDGDGVFETSGQSVPFAGLDGPASATVRVRVTDEGGLSDVAEATVEITNVAPTVTSLTVVPTQTFTGENVTFTGAATDPSGPDTAAGFTWSFDTGSGFGAFGGNSVVTSFASCGTYSVAAKARDKDGGVSEPFSAAPVQVYGGSILAPLNADEVNLVRAGQVVPVKITVGCDGFLGGLHPLISVRAGDYDPNVDPGDPSYEVGENAGSADANGVMREVGEQYLYNLVVPAGPPGSFFTVLIRPFGGTSPALHALLRIRR
jgi:endonuclease/exonuclease/phosphatase family metal-dependent hydrolase